MTSAVEALVRYLKSDGQLPSGCVPFLPRQRRYALASLPTTLSSGEVARTVLSPDRATPMGRRDHAVLLLVATYGLRASEAAALTLDDVDWRQGILHIRQPKTRRSIELPLMPPIVDALVDYLRNGRPQTESRTIFLKCHAPAGPINRTVVYELVRKAIEHAGVTSEHYGPHVLRHARATTLVREGHSLKVVGDLLGHRVPEATLIYCKLAVEDLRGVALDLPEVAS